MTSPRIQKDIINAAAIETTTAIAINIEQKLFSILVDEARDVSLKEQMIVALRFVNSKGSVIECILGVEYVADTNSFS